MRRLGLALAVAGWLAIALATLTPTRGDGTTASPDCVACDAGWGADLLANVLLFVPLGAGLALAGVRTRRALGAVALTTLAVEVLQVAFVPGRDASLRDLATNFAGGAIGWVAFRQRETLLHPAPVRAAALAAAWSAVWIAGTAISAWAFTPSLPASLWWAHWRTPAVDSDQVGNGAPVVLDATVGGVSVAPGRLGGWAALRPRLLDGAPMTVRAVVAPGRAAADAEIATVNDADTEQDLLAFRRRGAGVAFYFRTRGAALRLRSPAIASGDFLSAGAADTVRLAGTFAAGRLRLDAERGGGPRLTRSIDVSPNWGWSFFVPSAYAFGGETRLLTAVWVACLVLPIAYWAGRGERAPSAAARTLARAAAIAPAVALVAVPLLYSLRPVHWSEWLAWATGTAAGFAASRGGGARRSSREIGELPRVATGRPDSPAAALAAAFTAPAHNSTASPALVPSIAGAHE